jgi:hypothetical protein
LMAVAAGSVFDNLGALALGADHGHRHMMPETELNINTYLAIPQNTLKIGCKTSQTCLHRKTPTNPVFAVQCRPWGYAPIRAAGLKRAKMGIRNLDV